MFSSSRQFFKNKRKSKKLNLQQLAKLVGYKNVNKGANKIAFFENGDKFYIDLIIKCLKILDINKDKFILLMQEDLQKWLDEPQKMEIIVRVMPAIYSNRTLPDTIKSEDKALKLACRYARMIKRRICFVQSRKKVFWINGDGKIYYTDIADVKTFQVPFLPYMKIKNKKLLISCK